MSDDILITIIGGGIVGCAVAFELSKTISSDIVVIEKNPQINGENQSSRNSGVVHAGIYYPNDIGPLKAKLCVEGNRLIYDFCKKNNIPCIRTGKLIVATEDLEEDYLEDVLRNGRDNGVPGLRVLNSNELKRSEPNVAGKKAVMVPTSGIIESTKFLESVYRSSESNGVIYVTGNEVIDIKPGDRGFLVKMRSRSGTESFRTKTLINAAGLFSDEIARMVDPVFNYTMDPIKGESAKFYCSKREGLSLSGMNIYPVPFGYYPDGERARIDYKKFLKLFKRGILYKSVGVHITSAFDLEKGKYCIGDTATIGPAYSIPESKEDYKSSREEDYYYQMVHPFFPNLKIEDISLYQVGIRAKLKDHYDFVIEKDQKYPDCIHLVGIDSPGLTSSLAIAKYVGRMLRERT